MVDLLAMAIGKEEAAKLRRELKKLNIDELKKQIESYAAKVDELHNTANINNQILNQIAVYCQEEDPERWKKAKGKVKTIVDKKEAEIKARRIWGG